MMVIGIYNIKGGVGKTTSSVNLAYLASQSGAKTILWDLDPQGSSTFYFHKKQGIDTSTKKVISGKASLDELLKKTNYKNLDLIPSDFSFRNMDVLLDDVKKSKKRLAEILKPLKNQYDYVFLDCPPGISLLSENVFHAADYLVVPTVPTPLSLRTYEQIINFFNENELDTSRIIPFFSMVELRKKIHRDSIAELTQKIPGVCQNYIPFLSDFEKMGLHQKPVPAFRPTSKAALAFIALWEELQAEKLRVNT